jgi:hypothetical protein
MPMHRRLGTQPVLKLRRLFTTQQKMSVQCQ